MRALCSGCGSLGAEALNFSHAARPTAGALAVQTVYLTSGGWLRSLDHMRLLTNSSKGYIVSSREFAKCIYRQYLAGVSGMLSFEPFLESRYAALAIRGCVAVHLVGAFAAS